MSFIEKILRFWKIRISIILSSLLLLSAAPVFGQYVEVAKITASDAEADDYFGFSVAISGERIIVGAKLEDAGGSSAGAAYIFESGSTGIWSEVTKIMASDREPFDQFGTSVAIDGDRIIVGANRESSGGLEAGAAYIFEHDSIGNWTEVAKIMAADAQPADMFGEAVAISGDRAIVGARFEDSAGTDAGAAYIFERDASGNWSEVAKLMASDAEQIDWFGYAVAIDGSYAIVGAYREDTGGPDTGAAYIFERDAAGNWNEVTKIQASDKETGDWFGYSVAINGNKAIVGAHGEDTGGGDAGAAYIFERDDTGNWNEVAKIQASDKETFEYFGASVSISNNRAIVGAYREDSGATDAGAAYIFERDAAGNWNEATKLQASDKESNDWFGYSVAISEHRAVVGAYLEDSGGFDAGAAYIFAGAPVGIAGSTLPQAFELEQNYPNPFNPSTTIGFTLPQSAAVSLKIFDINGQLVKTLLNGTRAAGTHRVIWDGTDQSGNGVTSGVYLYRLSAGSFTQTRKMMLMK
jgi:hypothetical protein